MEIISAHGTDSGAKISGGEQDVYGTANGATIFTGSQVVESGGSASGAIISGGTQVVDSGGSASATTISTGGLEIISAHGTDSGAKISGGEQDVYGVATGATIFTGSQVVEFGGTASSTVVSGGALVVVSGGLADATRFPRAAWKSSAAPMTVHRFRAARRTFTAPPTAPRSSPGASGRGRRHGEQHDCQRRHDRGGRGGTTSDTTVSAVAFWIGGRHRERLTIVAGGILEIVSGGRSGFTSCQLRCRGCVDGTASGTIISGGTQVVDSGGSANATTFSTGGVDFDQRDRCQRWRGSTSTPAARRSATTLDTGLMTLGGFGMSGGTAIGVVMNGASEENVFLGRNRTSVRR